MKNKIREILKGTYFNRNRSLGLACFLLIGNSILVTALAGMAIFLFVGLASLIISYLFLWIGLGNIANKIAFFSFIIAFVGGLACCMGWGAEKGVECFKEILGLPLDELEGTLNNLSFEKRGKLKQKISEYIYKSIEKIDENELEN